MCYLKSFLLFSFGFNSPQHSLPSRKYPAAHTSFPIHLCVCLLAATSTSLPWKAHVCLQASWLLALGEFESQTEAAVVIKRKKKKKKLSSHLLFASAGCWYRSGNLLGYVPLWSGFTKIRFRSAIFFTLFYFLPSFCRCLIVFRRSTRWSTVATAPLRGVWISDQLQNLWRGYDLIWMGRMRLMAGMSWMDIWYLPLNTIWTHLYAFICSKSGGDSTLIQKLAEMSKSNLDHINKFKFLFSYLHCFLMCFSISHQAGERLFLLCNGYYY